MNLARRFVLISLLGSLLLVTAGESARADARARCHQTIDQVLGVAPHRVTPPPCNPIDPSCAALQSAAGSIQEIQRRHKGAGRQGQLSAECKPIVEHRCDAYASLLDQGKSENDAWRCAMSGCSQSPDTANSALVDCICKGEPDLSVCGPQAENPPPPIAVPPPVERPPLPPTDLPQPSSATNPKL